MKMNQLTLLKTLGAGVPLMLSALSLMTVTPSQAEPLQVQTRRVATHVVPTYPNIAKTLRLSGDVIVDLTVKQDGSVADAEALSGNVLLKNTAVEASKHWKFEPTDQETKYRVIYEFVNP